MDTPSIPQKRCNTCGKEYPETIEFFKLPPGRNKFRLKCRFCDREYTRKWREANPRKMAEFIKSAAHKESNRRYREVHPEKTREYCTRWRKKNPDKARASAHRRRARQQKSEGSYTAEDIQRQYKAQKGKCYWCGEKVGKKYHVDHVIPLGRGGTNWPSNLVIACPFCNESKNDKLPHEWRGNRGKLL